MSRAQTRHTKHEDGQVVGRAHNELESGVYYELIVLVEALLELFGNSTILLAFLQLFEDIYGVRGKV